MRADRPCCFPAPAEQDYIVSLQIISLTSTPLPGPAQSHDVTHVLLSLANIGSAGLQHVQQVWEHAQQQMASHHPAGMVGELLRMQGCPQASAARLLSPWLARGLQALSATRAAAPQGQSRAAARAEPHRQRRTQQWSPALAAGLLGDSAALLRSALKLLMLQVLARFPELEAPVVEQPGAEHPLRGQSAQSHLCLDRRFPWPRPALALISSVQHCFLQVLCWDAPSDLLG